MIKVIDNLIADKYLIDEFFQKYILGGQLQLSFSNKGDPLEQHAHSFTSSLNNNNFVLPLIYDVYKKCKNLLPDSNTHINKWHANVYPSGFDGTIHFDHHYSAPTYLYCVSPWSPEWGGEFIVYDEQLEAKAVASYKQDRLIIFDGKYPHRATAPTRLSSLLRATIAFHTERVEK
tara:strand:+ start:62 stop:586 length:525 start_codon:yes stop_codon:yes gene_type:complete